MTTRPLATCPFCGHRFLVPLQTGTTVNADELVMLGYKTVDEILIELLAMYPAESLISHIQNIACAPKEHLTAGGK